MESDHTMYDHVNDIVLTYDGQEAHNNNHKMRHIPNRI